MSQNDRRSQDELDLMDGGDGSNMGVFETLWFAVIFVGFWLALALFPELAALPALEHPAAKAAVILSVVLVGTLAPALVKRLRRRT